MAIGLELHWVRCADGAEWVDRGQPRPTPKGKRVALGNPETGIWIRHRSTNVKSYALRLVDLKDAMLERFLNCDTPDHFAEFASRYGLPGPAGGMDATEQSAASMVNVRDGFRRVLDLKETAAPKRFASAFNKASAALQGARLTPTFNLWANATAPTMTFMPGSPYGMMLMQVALATTEATRLQTCFQCGSAFLAGSLTQKKTGSLYCSNRCRVAHQRTPAK